MPISRPIPTQMTLYTSPLDNFPHKSTPIQFHKPMLFLKALQNHYITDNTAPVISSIFLVSRVVKFDYEHWVVQEWPGEIRQTIFASFLFLL